MVPILIAIVVALLVCFVLYSQMKSVAERDDAQEYLVGGLNITQQSDIYTHTTKTRRKIEHNDK